MHETKGGMHVQILNQTFHPDTTATAQLMWDLAVHLVGRGHRVTAVASRQVYGTDKLHSTARETVDGVEIVRLRGTAFGKRTLPGRASDFATFYAAAAAGLARLDAPDVMLVLTSPPMIGAVAAGSIAWRKTVGHKAPRLVHHVMDLYPEATAAHGMMRPTHPLYRTCHAATGRSLAAADAIIALGHDMRDLLCRSYGLRCPRDRVHVVQPWAPGDELRPLPRADNAMARELGLADTYNVVYSGNLGLAHDVDTFAAAMAATAGDPAFADLRWVFVGGGQRTADLKARVASAGWGHVRFLPHAPRERLNESLNLADVHLVSQLPDWTGIVVPSKQFGIMAVGRPSVMVGPADAECSRVIVEHDAGRVVGNGDGVGLVAALRELRDEAVRRRLGDNARAAFERFYSRDVACSRIEKILEPPAVSEVEPQMNADERR